jgi:hypothetical protein
MTRPPARAAERFANGRASLVFTVKVNGITMPTD